MFRFFSSRFKFDKYKESCARITVSRDYKIANCFTLECSSYGYIKKDRTTQQFREIDLIEFGKSVCESVLEYMLILDKDRKFKEEIRARIRSRKNNKKPRV